jgi:YbbR domain-containing protein
MYDVKVVPAKVKAVVTIVRQLGTNDFPIKANLSGKLPDGVNLKEVKITPSSVRLTAEPKVLGGIKQILTAPIVLNNITSDVELKMPLQIPDQVLADQHSVLVEITLDKGGSNQQENKNDNTAQNQ